MRGLFTKRSAAGMALLAVLACAPGASASITYNTPVGSNTEWDNNTNFPVSASAVFTMSAGFFTVTLTNFTGDTFYNSQNLSGITFNLDNGGPALTNVASSTVTNGSVAVVNPGGGSTTASGTPLAANTAVSPRTPASAGSWRISLPTGPLVRPPLQASMAAAMRMSVRMRMSSPPPGPAPITE